MLMTLATRNRLNHPAPSPEIESVSAEPTIDLEQLSFAFAASFGSMSRLQRLRLALRLGRSVSREAAPAGKAEALLAGIATGAGGGRGAGPF
jgi:hypothetical protein